MKSVKSEFVSEEFYPTLSDYGKSGYMIVIPETITCMLHEQRVLYAPHEFGAKR